MVPGSSGDGSTGDGDDGGGGRVKFPSRREQFLAFVALSEWLLQQLGSGRLDDGRGCAPAAMSSPSEVSTTVSVSILRGCQVGRWMGPSSSCGG